MKKLLQFLLCFLVVYGCDSTNPTQPSGTLSDKEREELLNLYPDFITKNEDYFEFSIDAVPIISAESYTLTITGIGDEKLTFTLDDLTALDMIEYPLTVECIGNFKSGLQVGTVYWKGFDMYEFLIGIGMDELTGGVKYRAYDEYFSSHSIDELKSGSIIGALYMNGVSLPPAHGFPLRIISPGKYGVKQPAWVTSIQVLSEEEYVSERKDFWDRGWIVDEPMGADSKIFFPVNNTSFSTDETVAVGGAAYCYGRIARVELSTDSGENWTATEIIKSIDADNVWVFWYAELSYTEQGTYNIFSRAIDSEGNVQQKTDDNPSDGITSQPSITIIVQ